MPHPEVVKAYNEAKFPIPQSPQDVGEATYRQKTKKAREDEIKKTINQVWRTSMGPNKDFIFYEYKETAPDFAENPTDHTFQEGRYDKPKFKNVFNAQSGEPEATTLSGFETKYDIPYSKGKMQEILDSGDSSNTFFTLVVGNRKYGGFTAEDFVNKPYDELVEMAVYGNVRPKVSRPDLLKAQQERENELKENERLIAEDAKARFAQVQEQQQEANEKFLREQEEEAKKRQEAVGEQFAKRTQQTAVVRESGTAKYNVEGKPKPAINEPNKISEDVSYIIKNEDENADEEEELAKNYSAAVTGTEETKSKSNKKTHSANKQQ